MTGAIDLVRGCLYSPRIREEFFSEVRHHLNTQTTPRIVHLGLRLTFPNGILAARWPPREGASAAMVGFEVAMGFVYLLVVLWVLDNIADNTEGNAQRRDLPKVDKES